MLQLKELTLEKETIKQKKLNTSSSSVAPNANGELLLKQNPFKIGKLYKFTKYKPPLAPIYVKHKTRWIGTTTGIDIQTYANYQDKILLCVDSIEHSDISGYSGIFLFDDQFIGLCMEWVKHI